MILKYIIITCNLLHAALLTANLLHFDVVVSLSIIFLSWLQNSWLQSSSIGTHIPNVLLLHSWEPPIALIKPPRFQSLPSWNGVFFTRPPDTTSFNFSGLLLMSRPLAAFLITSEWLSLLQKPVTWIFPDGISLYKSRVSLYLSH